MIKMEAADIGGDQEVSCGLDNESLSIVRTSDDLFSTFSRQQAADSFWCPHFCPTDSRSSDGLTGNSYIKVCEI
jgi:hypothetical protein